MSLMIATGFVAAVTLSAMLSLRTLAAESEIQGDDRRARQAFFAAEAGLAEGREAARLLLGNDPSFTNAFAKLGNRYAGAGANAGGFVQEAADGFPSAAGNEWYEILPWTNYTLSVGAGAALDSGVGTADRELTDQDGNPYQSFPNYSGTRYRVFLRDDDDGDANRRTDANGRVWVISVGEVASPLGGLPVRSVVQVLVQAGDQNLVGGPCRQHGCDPAHEAAPLVDSKSPDLTGAPMKL
jgi:hypothetical protein